MPPPQKNSESDVQYKIVLVGDAGVGKTNILAYYKDADVDARDEPWQLSVATSFSQACKPTVGVEFATKIIVHPNGTRIKAQIWDTAGQERYRAITTSHYRRAAGALLVYDVSSKNTFKSLRRWVDLLRDNADSTSNLLDNVSVVGNKIDLESTMECVNEIEQLKAVEDFFPRRKQNNSVVCERTSAKTGAGIVEAFERLVIRVYDLDISGRETEGKQKSANSNHNGGGLVKLVGEGTTQQLQEGTATCC